VQPTPCHIQTLVISIPSTCAAAQTVAEISPTENLFFLLFKTWMDDTPSTPPGIEGTADDTAVPSIRGGVLGVLERCDNVHY